MKPFLDVEKNRVSYHKSIKTNTVHRSSLIVPKFDQAVSNISFLNHFILKRNNRDVILKITAINDNGVMQDSVSVEINEPIVYSLNLENFFEQASIIKEYLVEFYSGKNLFIPFPAVMVNHIGNEFVNCVHSFNRILNDVFENDKVNLHQVFESSIDVSMDEDYDTFFNFATGPFKVKSDLQLLLIEEDKKSYIIPIEMERLSNKNIFLSNFYKKSIKNEAILKILQPEQTLFYGRLLTGRINKKTRAFSANHSYYDSSLTKEYFDNSVSMRTYPFFNNCLNKIIMYPIMSPSSLEVFIEIYGNNETYKSDTQIIESPSNSPILFDINELVKKSGLNDVNLFKVIAQSSTGKIPTRVNHQLIYGKKDSLSKLYSSINLSLLNESIYTPPLKTGITWGQVLVNKSYESRLGICFMNNSGASDEVSVDFYCNSGLFKSIKHNLNPNNSLILDSKFFKKIKAPNEFIWYLAKSKRADLQADSFHYHISSGNASGEHSF
tara:strand:+ start:372 stop:1856 length:1485 start_codon:yes stop_codon:yes gene_type:complete